MASDRNPRLPELDGLRGLAALTVFFSHVIGLFPGHEAFRVQKTPLHILWDGNAAVVFFFLLSGYVLALPFVDAGRRAIRPASFIIKRLFRLYPAYWCGLALALVFRAYVIQHDHLYLLSS
jgi:peptidoglycan/LPS O-acetylase OafA/YrhL